MEQAVVSKRLGVSLPLVAICIACSCSSGSGHVAKPTPTIVVIEPGAEPRQRIRYEPAPGLVEDVETSTKVRIANTFTNTTLETGQRNADFPTVIMRGQLHVTGRSREGHALVSFAAGDARTLDDVVDPAMRRMVDAQVHALERVRATWRVLPSGELADIKFELPDAPEGTRGQFSALRESFDEMFVRFPDAEIGAGAIWQVESQKTSSGVTWTKKATYTLRELTDGQAVVDVSVAMRAPSQNLRVEPNATTTLKSGTGSVSGMALVPRRGLVISGSSEATTKIDLLIVRRRLRLSSVVRTETISYVKRIGTNAESAAPHPVDDQSGTSAPPVEEQPSPSPPPSPP